MDESWGPWIEHDGNGCPCRGAWVRLEHRNGHINEARATGDRTANGSCWDWRSITPQWRGYEIIRYRIRKPRGLTILEELLADLPAPSAPKVDA